MAEILRTADHSIHFGRGNFRETPAEGVLRALCALAAGQRVILVLNGVRGTWERWAKGAMALKKVDDGAKRSWDVPVGTWLQIAVASPDVGSERALAPDRPALGTELSPQANNGPGVIRALTEASPASIKLPTSSTRVVYACDIGTTLQSPPNFGWARAVPGTPQSLVGSRDIEALAASLRQDLEVGLSVALGFESPLFLPVPVSSGRLSRAREGEGSMPWSAPVGAAVTALGVHQAAWILREAYAAGGASHEFTTNWNDWPATAHPVFFCWEAMVCGNAHSASNDPTQDAATALLEFLAWEQNLEGANAVKASPCISLIHAVAMWSGWAADVAGLHRATLVIRPCATHQGVVAPA